MMKMLRRMDLIYPQLSYIIIGILFDVYNNLGVGHKEKFYQKAIAIALIEASLMFKEQVYSPLVFRNKNVGKYYLDFVIENKIALEIKSGEKYLKPDIKQLYGYLKAQNLKLGILAYFTKTGLQFRRILNINSYYS